jgi:uncharacterized protein YndB with AHSA1/START domain
MVRKGKIMTAKNEFPAGSPVAELHITRIFDSSREALFKAWTDPEQLKRWWGPGDFRWMGCRMQLYPGGFFHYCMRSPEGIDMWGRFVYLEVRPSERLIFINSFSDEDGNPVKHPLMPDWPLEILNVLTFTDNRFGTTMDLYCIPHSASGREWRNFEAGMESVRLGFAATWERLAAFLK